MNEILNWHFPDFRIEFLDNLYCNYERLVNECKFSFIQLMLLLLLQYIVNIEIRCKHVECSRCIFSK